MAPRNSREPKHCFLMTLVEVGHLHHAVNGFPLGDIAMSSLTGAVPVSRDIANDGSEGRFAKASVGCKCCLKWPVSIGLDTELANLSQF